MKKIIFILLLATFPLFARMVKAADTASGSSRTIVNPPAIRITGQPGVMPDGGNIVFPPINNGLNFLGQNHFYTVTFRGNGEAVVLLKVILANTFSLPLSKVDLELSKISPKDTIVYQVIREPQCLRYQSPILRTQGSTNEQPQRAIYPNPQPSRTPDCLEYAEPDYFQNYFGQATYQKADYEIKGETLDISLPAEIKPNRSGSYILYFRAFGYTKGDMFGDIDYAFETLKIHDQIRTVQVGINTDSDLLLKGAKGQVNYSFNQGISAINKPNGAALPMANNTFDNLYQNIGQGSIVKTASNLQPLESYKVSGSYADTIWKLYAKEIMSAMVVIFLVVLMGLLIIKLALGKATKEQGMMAEGLMIFGLSFIFSIFVLGYTFLIYFIFVYQPFFLGEFSIFLNLIVMVVSIGVYALLILGPALIMAIKKGWGAGLATFALVVFWLMIYLVIIFVVVFIGLVTPLGILPKPVPLLYGSQGLMK